MPGSRCAAARSTAAVSRAARGLLAQARVRAPGRDRAALAATLLLACCGGSEPVAPATWTPAFDATETGWLLDVWGPAADDLFAVGGRPTQGAILHYDGASWRPLDPGLPVPLLNWIHGFGPDDITMVGNGGTVIHWDGHAFARQETPTDQALWGVWGATPDDLWAAGGRGLEDGDATLLHFDGQAWSAAQLPALQRAQVYAFYKVWGTAANDVYVVGQRGAVLHWDGAAWREQLAGASDDLISLWGMGPDHIVAVGGRGNGIVTVWDGKSWTPHSLVPAPGLNGIWLDSDRVAHVVGELGTVLSLDLDTMQATSERSGTALDVHAVFGVGGRLTAVGGSLASASGPYVGVALTRPYGASE